MSDVINIIVNLKSRDAIAETAFHCLKEDMGYANLHSISRAELWQVRVDLSGFESVLEYGKKLAESTKIFLNPNKHTYRLIPHVEQIESIEQLPDDNFKVTITTRQIENEKSSHALQLIRSLYDFGGSVRSIEFRTIWILTVSAKSMQSALRIVGEMAVTTDHKHGLLANPHAQIIRIPPYPGK